MTYNGMLVVGSPPRRYHHFTGCNCPTCPSMEAIIQHPVTMHTHIQCENCGWSFGIVKDLFSNFHVMSHLDVATWVVVLPDGRIS